MAKIVNKIDEITGEYVVLQINVWYNMGGKHAIILEEL